MARCRIRLKQWCREHARFLVVGGKDPVGTNNYYNTAFVVGTNGEIVFQQAKCVPIQFFKDGLPAPRQEVWNSPWGKIGICICYDLSYTRVTDRLVRGRGATVDCADHGCGGLGPARARTSLAGRARARGGIRHSRFSGSPVPAFRRRLPGMAMSSPKPPFPAAWTFSRRNSGCRREARCRWTGIWRRFVSASRPSSLLLLLFLAWKDKRTSRKG